MHPLPYHTALVGHLKASEKLWNFFAETVQDADARAHFRTELLKTTYRLEPDAEPALYAAVARIREALAVPHAVTVYHELTGTDLNASVFIEPGDAHILIGGPLLKMLTEEELTAVLAHELGHVELWAVQDGDFQTADRILRALAAGATAPPEYYESARQYDLYTELFCDRAALRVLQDPLAMIAALVKLATGLDRVSPEAYIRQAVEIFGAGEVLSESITHPENFIRAYALHLAHTAPEKYEEEMHRVITGHIRMRSLDVTARERMAAYTRALVAYLIADESCATDAHRTLAQQYFPGLLPIPDASAPDASLDDHWDEETLDYAGYILLDFAFADHRADEGRMARRAHAVAKDLGYADTLKKLAKKELKLSERGYNEKFNPGEKAARGRKAKSVAEPA